MSKQSEINVIKEFCVNERNIIVIVRSDSYGNTYQHISNLVTVARNYFNIEDKDIEIVKYGGKRYARTYGIEFSVKLGTPMPEEFTQVSSVEYTL